MKNLLAISLLLMIAFTSCKDDEGEYGPIPFEPVDSQMEPYFFETGSYWLYEGSNGSSDSTYVHNWTRGTHFLRPTHPGQGSSGELEYFELQFGSTLNGNYTEDIFSDLISENLYFDGFLYFGSKRVGDSRGNASLAEVHESFIVGTHTFSNVTEMHVSQDGSIPMQMHLFYADSVGLVRKDIIIPNDTTVFVLTDYQVSLFDRPEN